MINKQLAFYKGPGRLFDKLIRWWTGSPYSHVAIIVAGQCFEADAWQGKVVSRPWANNYNPDNWDMVDIEHDTSPASWLADQVGKRYDYLGILGFLIPWRFDVESWWYCSELAAAWLNLDPSELSPGELKSDVDCEQKLAI